MIYGFALLWFIRSSQRLINWQEIQIAFAIPTGSIIGGTVVVFLPGVLLMVLLYLAEGSRPSEAAVVHA